MASSKMITCGPCQQGKVNTSADICCYNCDEGLCSTCFSLHERLKLTHDHETIDIQTYKPSFGSNKTECDTHRQQLRLYCPSHLMPCCDECISKGHSKCTGIKSLANVVDQTKIEKSKKSVEKDITSILQLLDKMANNKSENIQRGEQQYQIIKESISKIRKEINKHLDQLEKKIYKEADTIWGLEKSKLTGFIVEIEEKRKSLKEMQEDLHAVKVHTSTLQSFLGIHQIDQQVHRCIQHVEEKNKAVREVDIKIKQNDEIQHIFRKMQSLISLGEVKVDETEITFTKETSVNRGAQVESQEQPKINKMTMNTETKIQTNLTDISFSYIPI
ncbi:protein wech-like [Mytilus californianus]|uniref:protein wech-like n=1 Tax=Mytilus californianus TaxID=6549 RepID=UPI0022452D9F|nr:protein wech-like [Mytilus californianus]